MGYQQVELLLKEKLKNVADVSAVYLFGSRALEIATAFSDYDYAILTKSNTHSKGDKLYNNLYTVLSEISPRKLINDVLDIVYLEQIGLEMKFHVIRYGRLLYDANPILRLAFENKTQLLYCDFKPILEQFDQEILNS